MTGMWPFEHAKESKKARKAIMKGMRPNISEAILQSTDPFDQAMVKSIEMSWIQDQEKRASARQVQAFIEKELDRLGVSKL
jgi:cytochrome c556